MAVCASSPLHFQFDGRALLRILRNSTLKGPKRNGLESTV